MRASAGHRGALLCGVLAVCAVAGCRRGEKRQAAFERPAITEASAPDEQIKLNGYVTAYNTLAGTFGLTDVYRDYAEQRLSRKSAKELLRVDDGSLPRALKELQAARALHGSGNGELDANGDALIAALSKVNARLKGLKAYYGSKAYQGDDMARGKLEDAPMLMEFAAAVKARDQFDRVLDAAMQRRDAQRLDALKSGGHMLAYQSKVAMLQASGVLDAFRKATSLKDASLFAVCDPQIAALETTLAEQRSALTAEKASAKEPVAAEYELVGTYLTSLAQRYRAVKVSRSQADYEKMVEEYNSAVEQANDLHD